MILKLVTALIILLVLGDAYSTYLVLSYLPGTEELNPFAVLTIEWWGIPAAMAFSATWRTAATLWLYRMARTTEFRGFIVALGYFFVVMMTSAANVNNWMIWLLNS